MGGVPLRCALNRSAYSSWTAPIAAPSALFHEVIMTEDDDRSRKIRDMVLFQAVTGARRVRLDDNWCGYDLANQQVPCFQGHEVFDDELAWAEHCPGPAYSTDPAAMVAVEQALRERGHLGRYLRALLTQVYPRYADVQIDQEVYDFWYALLSVGPAPRVAAALAALGCSPKSGKISPHRREPETASLSDRHIRGLIGAIERSIQRAHALGEMAEAPRWVAEILDAAALPQLRTLMSIYLLGRDEQSAGADPELPEHLTSRHAIVAALRSDPKVHERLLRGWKRYRKRQ